MTLLYIDPQSYDNLEIYDKSLLNQLPKDCNILYACSFLIKEGGMSCNIEALPLFKYNRKKDGYFEIDEPEGFTHVVGFGIG